MAEIIYLRNGDYINNYNEIPEYLANQCGAEIVGAEPIVNGVVICLEKFYFRNKSYAALTVIIQNESTGSRATLIGSGGGEGLFNISWGANSDFAVSAANALNTRYRMYQGE